VLALDDQFEFTLLAQVPALAEPGVFRVVSTADGAFLEVFVTIEWLADFHPPQLDSWEAYSLADADGLLTVDVGIDGGRSLRGIAAFMPLPQAEVDVLRAGETLSVIVSCHVSEPFGTSRPVSVDPAP
jgi:hypothetical protein